MLTRLVTPDDAASLADLATSLGQQRSISDFQQDIDRHTGDFFVGEVDGEIISYMILRQEQAPSCVPGVFPIQLWRMYIAAAYQGKGMGRSMMGKAFVHAHSRRHDALWLGTDPDNRRAIAFYEKCGLYATGHAPLHGDGASSDLIMACTLG